MVTVFKDIFSKEPYYSEVGIMLERIKNGKSKAIVDLVRAETNSKKKDVLKQQLPCVLFSGKFSNRLDNSLIEHSGFVILDFDQCEPTEVKAELAEKPWIYAAWTSPGGEGVKALVKIKDPSLHRQHLKALFKELPGVDPVNINTARVCYESVDPEIYINENAIVYEVAVDKVDGFDQTKLTLGVESMEPAANEIFKNIQKWMLKKGGAFVTGERNVFIYKLAGACSRFGIDQADCISLISSHYLTKDSDFSHREAESAIKSAYKSPGNKFASAKFEKNSPVTVDTRKPIEVSDLGEPEKLKDVIYGADVAADALKLYDNGYESAETTFIPALDEYFKWKRRELTVVTGIGNYGKSTYVKFLCLTKSKLNGDKWAWFGPEDNPAEEFYHDLTEMYLGCNCTPSNPARPSREEYLTAYNFITAHFFYVYPKENDPTPIYVNEVFLELVIKEGVSGVVIDPFNNLLNDYTLTGGREDKYLEHILGKFIKFAHVNNVFFVVIAHPKTLQKQKDGSYACPEVFDLAGGAMWNNRVDNILVYDRPNHHSDPNSSACDHHSKKIRRQKIVGKKGMLPFDFIRSKRRFFFDGFCPLAKEGETPGYIAPRRIANTEKKKKEYVPGIQEDLDLPF